MLSPPNPRGPAEVNSAGPRFPGIGSCVLGEMRPMPSVLLFLILAASPVWPGVGALLPATPSIDGRTALNPAIEREGLPVMEEANALGLGEETRRLRRWLEGKTPPIFLLASERWIESSTADRMRVSVEMARTLRRLDQWYGLAATERDPITHEQLRAATLKAGSISRIRQIFDRAIARGVRTGDRWLTPEAGGEATIDDELRLVEAEDPSWTIVRDLAKVMADPEAVSRLAVARPLEVTRIDRHQLLSLALARFRLQARGAAEEVRRAVITVAENAAPTYAHEPAQQFAIIAANDWRGRYVGRWHTHAPHLRNGTWTSGEGPSFEDMQNAVAAGQYLTLAFQPDGFDLHDASALADAGRVDLTLMKVIRYRSPEWRKHFDDLLPAIR